MKRRSNLTQSEGGQILIFVIIILMLAVLVIPAILGLTYSSAHTIDIRTEKTQALYAADSGIEDALYKLSNLGNDTLQVADYSSSNCGGNLVEKDDWVEYTLGAPGPLTINNSQVQVTIEYRGNATYGEFTLPTYLIKATASSSANPTVTVQAHVYIGNNTGNIYQPGVYTPSTSPFDYAMANLDSSITLNFQAAHPPTITGDVFSNGPIDFPGGSIVQGDGTHAGNVWANGAVTLESSGVNIAGDVHSTGDITLGDTANIGGSAYAGGSIQATGTASKIWSSAWANGTINVGLITKKSGVAGSGSGIAHSILAGGDIDVIGPVSSWTYNVGGNVSSNGNVIVEENGKISGWVDAHGTITTKTGGVIVGTPTPYVPEFTVPLPAIPTLVADNVSFWQDWYGNQSKLGGTVTGDINFGGGNLGPVYINGSLTLGTNAVVQLMGIVYVTGSVTIKEGVTIYGPGTIVAEGTYSDKEGSVYGAPGQEVMLMSLSTAGIDTKSKGNEYCVFYAPFGPINFQNWVNVNGAVIGQDITSNNGFNASWTSAVYNIPGLPGVYVPGSPGPGSTVQQTSFAGPVIDWYKVCDTQSCSP